MSILFTADWQCALNNLDRCQQALDHIMSIIDEHNCAAVVHLGDVKESTNPWDVRVSNFLVHAVKQITAKVSMLILRGNHDMIQSRDGVPSCLPVLAAAGADVFEDPQEITVYDHKSMFQKSCTLWMVPYYRDLKAQKDALFNAVRAGPDDIICFHNEITGCKSTLWRTGEGIDLADLPTGRLCIGGHIHHQQQVAPKVWYTGSPFCNDKGECNESKGYLLVDAITKTVTPIPSRIPGWYKPDSAGYKPPSNWNGSRVYIDVPVALDPQKDLLAARKAAESQYSGAQIVLTPVFQSGNTAAKVEAGSDEDMLTQYLNQIDLPPDVYAEQILTYLNKCLPAGGVLGVQKLKFLHVSAGNTLCFKQCNLRLDGRGLVLVTGNNLDWPPHSNGSGKTSLLSLPFIALFGVTPKWQKFDGWASITNSGQAVVTLEVELANGKRCVISRSRRPAALVVNVDGQDFTMGSPQATQSQIECLTNLTWDVLTNAIYVSQREIGSVFGTEKERKELFSHLLGLDRFLDAQKIIKEDLKRCAAALEDVRAASSYNIASIEQAKCAGEDIKKRLKALPPALETDELEQQLKKAQQKHCEQETAVNALSDDLEMMLGSVERFGQAAAAAHERAAMLEEQLQAATQVKRGKKCPTCGRVVDSKCLASHAADIRAKLADALLCETNAKNQLRSSQNDKTSATYRYKEANRDRIATHGQIETLTLELRSRQQAAATRVQWEQVLAERQAVIDNLLHNNKIHEKAQDAWLQEQQFLQFCYDTVGRDGLPAYLCHTVIPQLNAAASRYSALFTDGEIGLLFTEDQGEVNLRVLNTHGGLEINDQSMGEMRTAAIIAALSFRDVLVPHNILILDEPSEGLDAANAAAFAKGLKQIVSRFGTVFVVSHNTAILSQLEPDVHIEVTKHHGVATVKEI